MSEVVWEDPPADSRGFGPKRGRWVDLAEELKEHPGKWALVLKDATWRQVNSAYASLKKRGCETRFHGATVEARSNDSATMSMYARWPEDVA